MVYRKSVSPLVSSRSARAEFSSNAIGIDSGITTRGSSVDWTNNGPEQTGLQSPRGLSRGVTSQSHVQESHDLEQPGDIDAFLDPQLTEDASMEELTSTSSSENFDIHGIFAFDDNLLNGSISTFEQNGTVLPDTDDLTWSSLTDPELCTQLLCEPLITENGGNPPSVQVSPKAMCATAKPLLPHESRASGAQLGIHTMPRSDWIKRLAEINVELWETADAIPDTSTSGVPTPRSVNWFSFDTTFALSTELTKLLAAAHAKPLESGLQALPTKITRSQSYDHRFTAPGLKASRMSAESVHSKGYASMDASTALLVLSSYLRILEILSHSFSSFRALLRHMNIRELLTHVSLPSLNFGSFSLQYSPILQITLITRLAEEILSGLRDQILPAQYSLDLPGAAQSMSDDEQITRDGSSKAMLHMIWSRESNVNKVMNELRRTIQSVEAPHKAP